MKKRDIWVGVLLIGFLLAGMVRANNISITNVTLTNFDGTNADIRCTVSWDNSWRAGFEDDYGKRSTNWDSAWLFVKYRRSGGLWRHAVLSGSGHSAGDGTAGVIDVGLSEDRNVGAFVYRAVEGSGTVVYSNLTLHWNCASNGVTDTNVDVMVHAIEMVNVPEGAHWLGGTGQEGYGFYMPGSETGYLVTNEYEITIKTNAGNLFWRNTNGFTASLVAKFPKGYKAFYCMKYEITQGQYAEFLRSISMTQARLNEIGIIYVTSGRMTIHGDWPDYVADMPDVACARLSGNRFMAYGDWAGLRPMTELEYEKACRGTQPPILHEFAWGEYPEYQEEWSNVLVSVTGFCGAAVGSGEEKALPTNANVALRIANERPEIGGLVRAGLFASSNTTRRTAGASFYGIMELTGNAHEFCVWVGSVDGRDFTGEHGDGELNVDGTSNVSYWPVSLTDGLMCRGGGYLTVPETEAAVSARYHAGSYWNDGSADPYAQGGRLVRTAP